jgi:hypothetical protein
MSECGLKVFETSSNDSIKREDMIPFEKSALGWSRQRESYWIE